MFMLRMLCLACVAVLSSALQLPVCSSAAASRLSASRVASVARAALWMCDAPAEEAEAAAEPVAEAAAEPVAEAAEPVAEAAAPADEAEPAARKGKRSKKKLEELEVGAEVEGKIRSVMSYGAFVDIGAQTDALLHVSEISNEFVKDATEKLTAGETITAKIKAINLEKQQLALTCKDPQEQRERAPRRSKVDLSEYEGADDKEFITGKVNSITDFGAFVTIKEGVDGLVHISQVQEGGVGQVSDVLTVGQEVKVRVTNVDVAKRRIGLSMLEWREPSERPQRGGRGGGGGGGFGDDDKEFKMTVEELEALTVGDDFSSPFEAAFERAEFVQQAKSGKKKYAKQLL